MKRSASHTERFANPNFKPLWEPNTAIGGNAIRYSLVHHVYQQRISTAGLCGFCTGELTRRVSEAAQRLKSRGLFHDDSAFMDLVWQQDSDNGALVAGETIVTVNKDGEKISVVDHAVELARERSAANPSWWSECGLGFQSELATMDRIEAFPRGVSWFGCRGDTGRGDVTPWESRFLGVLCTYTDKDVANVRMRDFVDWQERWLNYTHESCQCEDVLRLKESGVSFEDALMARVVTQINPGVWSVIPVPSEEIWKNRRLFLAYFEEQSRGIQNEESVWDYALSRGEVTLGNQVRVRPLPQGWQRRWVSNNTVWYHDYRGQLISRDAYYASLPDNPSDPHMSTTDEEEDLIEM